MVSVVVICGSRREASTTRAALRCALSAAEREGADTGMIDLGTVDLPLYHPDLDEQGESAELRATLRAADGAIVGSPVYHGSYSSTFRNFHDYCSKDDYENTAVGLLVTAGGGSYGPTLDHLRSTIRGVHGWVVPHQVGIRSAYEKVEDGRLVDQELRDRTERLGREVVAQARRLEKA